MKLPAIPALTAVEWIALAVSVIIVLLVVAWLVTSPAREARDRAEIRVDHVTAQEQQKAADQAAGIVDDANRIAAHNEEISRENERNIAAASGANQPIDPGVSSALHDSLCKRPSYSGTAYCLRSAHP